MNPVDVPNHGTHSDYCLVARYKVLDELDSFPWCTCNLIPHTTTIVVDAIRSKK